MRFSLIVLLWFVFVFTVSAGEIPDTLLDAIGRVESSWDNLAVGDKNLANRAHGIYQIRQPYLDDVNYIAGEERCQNIWGKDQLTMADIKADPGKARWCVRVYMEYYGRIYTQHTGKEPTAEVYTRIHNGGPFGWKHYATLAYWKQVKAAWKV